MNGLRDHLSKCGAAAPGCAISALHGRGRPCHIRTTKKTTLRSVDARSKRKRWRRRLKRTAIVLVCLAAVALITCGVCWVLFPFPEKRLARWPLSPMVLDAKGRPMLRIVGSDDHWRLDVPLERMSPWLVKATVAVEDKRFYAHPGIDGAAVVRAAGQNAAAGRVVSGASTLTMQLCRMMDGRPRTFPSKAVESFRALQLEELWTKDEIIERYLNVAPYGGNLRGVEAASLAYFGKHASELSLAEAALIAGLPQWPSRFRPDRNLDASLRRQRTVLRRMREERMITPAEYREALADPIVIRPATRRAAACHAAWLALARRPRGGRTTIDLDVQREVERVTAEHRRTLPADSEQAVVVIDLEHASIVAMIGSGDSDDPTDGQVNGVLAKRSPGSTLKPFVYAAAFEAGRLNGDAIVYDVPIRRGGWTPENFDRTFSGEVSAAEALRRSLNVPAILVAEGVGLARCCGTIEAAGVRLPSDAQARGGLGLAVGGMEVTLLDLTNAYATLARGGVRMKPRLFVDEPTARTPVLDANVCRAISHILSSHRRTPNGMTGRLTEDIPWFMWKTGTSSGRRDAWAVGHNGRYAVGVWVGRFRGTGRLAFVGAESAEPILAALFDLPELRATAAPPQPEPIVVRRPLRKPREVADTLEVTSPSRDDTFLALDGEAVIRPKANRRTDDLAWFLNGRLVPTSRAGRLSLGPGHYKLRCVDASGRSSGVRFVVLDAQSAEAVSRR